MRMIEAKLSPFLQSIADRTVGIVPEEPLTPDQIVRDSLRDLRLRVVNVLQKRGSPRNDSELINSWASPSITPYPLRLRPDDPIAMRQLRRYYMAKTTVCLDPPIALDIILCSFGTTRPEKARSVMINAPTIAHSRGVLLLTKMGDPPTEDTYGRLLTTKAIYPKSSSLSFVRFATQIDADHFGELVALFEQTDRVLPPSTNVRQNSGQIEKFSRRWVAQPPL